MKEAEQPSPAMRQIARGILARETDLGNLRDVVGTTLRAYENARSKLSQFLGPA